MASPGTVKSNQPHDPKEEKFVTSQRQRVQYLFKDLRWRAGRRAFEVWESDGGNVPAEEKVYLVHGELRKGPVAFLQWKLQSWKKQMASFFKGNSADHQAGRNAHMKA